MVRPFLTQNRIATGQIEEKMKAGLVKSGRAVAKARAEKLSADERQRIAKTASAARWKQSV
jgi:peptide subunit release factor RF-3